MLTLAIHADEAAKASLIERVRSDLEFAQDAVHLTEHLPADLTRLVLDKAAERVISVMGTAERGSYTISFTSPAMTLAMLGIRYSSRVDWQTLIRYLVSPAVTASSKRRVCIHLAHNHDRLPSEVALRLRDRISDFRHAAPVDFFDEDMGGSITYLAAALGLLEPGDVESHLLDHLLSTSQHRADAAAMIGHLGVTRLIPAAVGMLSDSDKDVVVNAASGLAAYAANRGVQADEAAIAGLRYAARMEGVSVPMNIARTLKQATPLAGTAREILATLTSHPSGWVRQTATSGLA